MPILTYVTRVEVAEPAVISGGTSYTAQMNLPSFLGTGGFETTSSHTRNAVLGNTSYVNGTTQSTRRFTGQNSTITYTQDSTRQQMVKIDSFGSTAVTLQSRTTRSVQEFTWVSPNTSALSTSYSHSCIFGATEVEAFGTVNNVLQYSFSRTFRNDDTEGFSSTVAGPGNAQSWTTSTNVSTGTSSTTSFTSSAGRFFSATGRVNVSTAIGQNITTRYVTSSATRTHTLTYGGSYTFTSFYTTNLFSTVNATVTYTSSSFGATSSVTITQLIPVTSTRTTSRTVPSFAVSGNHYHFTGNPKTVYANLIVIDDFSTTGQRLAVGPSTTGYQYASQFLAGGTGYTTSFSFIDGQVGSSVFGQPSGSTGSLTLVHDSYAATSTGNITYGRLVGLNTQGGFQTLGQSIFTTRAVLSPVTFTQTTGQSFATQSTSSVSGTSAGGVSSTVSTTYGYVSATGANTLSTTLAKTLWEALGTTTSSRTMRLLATSTSDTTLSRSFSAGSTVLQKTAVGANTTESSVVHGTVDRAFYVRTTSFSEHAPDVPALRFSQEVLMGAFIASPSDSVAYNSMNLPLIFLLSTYTPHDAGDFSFPGGMIPLAGSVVYNSSYYTQAYSISSNSTSLSFTYRATSAAASQTSTSSHVRTMGGSVAKMTLHHNDYAAPVDTTSLRSFPSGTGGAYSTGGSEAARFETPSFIASAIHATVGLNGTAGYNLEHDLVYGSGTAASIRNAGTATSSFPVSRSVASQRLFYGNRISDGAVAWSDAAPAFSEVTINPMVTVAPL